MLDIENGRKAINRLRKKYGGGEFNREYHIELGRAYKIPECCIKFWIFHRMKGILVGLMQRQKYNMESFMDIGYVPCDKCIQKIIKEN